MANRMILILRSEDTGTQRLPTDDLTQPRAETGS